MAMVDLHPARYGRTKPHGRRWIIDRYANLEGARDRISLRIDLPHPALCGDIGIVGECHDYISVFWSSAQHLSGHVEHSVPTGIARDREHRLTCLHYLAGFQQRGG